MTQLSIIIVSWNAKSFLSGCLESIRRFGSKVAYEIIVVDNASTDGSPEMVARDFPQVQLILSGENLGFARANNVGIERASGRFLALVNSDVLVHEGCFEKLIEFLADHKAVGLVGPRVVGGDGNLQRTCRRLPTVWNVFCASIGLDSAFPRSRFFSGRDMRHWDQETSAEVEVLSGCFWVARRDAVDQVGGLDERFFFYAEDVDWCKRFRESGWGVHFVAGAQATHFGGGSSVNAPVRYWTELLRANLAYWNKHHGFTGKVTYYVLSLIHHLVRLSVFLPQRFFSNGNRRIEISNKIDRSSVCLLWLLFGK